MDREAYLYVGTDPLPGEKLVTCRNAGSVPGLRDIINRLNSRQQG